MDVLKLQVCENLQKAIEDVQFDGTWNQFKTKVYNVGVEVLGLRKRNFVICLTRMISRSANFWKTKTSCTNNISVHPIKIVSLYISLLGMQNRQRRIRQMKNQWWSDISKETQKAYD